MNLSISIVLMHASTRAVCDTVVCLHRNKKITFYSKTISNVMKYNASADTEGCSKETNKLKPNS
ncbi:hypothetical protein KC19_VG218200 [Ceratodon purpureus]|uniref:Secreted protein n=1 Tax=Ceratodon purpureus TaxID=3225 RepID=A0A8T0HTN8_CERPU|nr:hypothetical protein KC19_VG218200 [Ceratodon purpureus]